MDLNVVLRADLHALIKKSLPDQLFTALYSHNSPIRDGFVRFLAMSYADWLSTQSDINDENIKKQWTFALAMPIQINSFANHEATKTSDIKHTTVVNTRNGTHSNGYDNNEDDSDINKSHELNNNSKEMNNLSNNNNSNIIEYKSNTKKQLREKKPLEIYMQSIEKDDHSTNGTLMSRTPSSSSSSSSSSSPASPPPIENLTNGTNGSYLRTSSPSLSPRIAPRVPLSPRNLNMESDGENKSPSKPNKDDIDELTNDQKAVLRNKLPVLTDISSIEKRNDVLIAKLKLCCIKFDFKSSNIWQMKGIEKKKTMLTEILEYITKFQWYSEPVLQQCVITISKNLFRTLPRRKKQVEGEEELFEDPLWPHLQLVYDLALRLIICTDIDKKVIRKYLEGRFVNGMVELFSSEDTREREYLKTILHRMYGRFMPLRTCIRQSIANACYQTIYDGERSENGIAEFLEIFCSIIHGFSVPVKDEHKEFLQTVLIPLHKCRRLEKFHEQLVACCVQFVIKDPSVSSMILGGLLRYWPVRSPTKEEMFIAEIVNVINAMVNNKNGFNIELHRNILLAVIDQLVKCMKSRHHSVAERALLIWSEDAIEALVDMDKKTIWSKIIPAFIENKNHWNDQLKESNEDAMEGFKARDQNTFTKISEDYLKSKTSQNGFDKTVNEKKKRKQHRWAAVRTLASQKSHQIKVNK